MAEGLSRVAMEDGARQKRFFQTVNENVQLNLVEHKLASFVS